MALLNHKTPAARYSHLNLAAGEKRVDTVFAGVTYVTSVEYFYRMTRHKMRLHMQNQQPCGDARIGIKRALVHT